MKRILIITEQDIAGLRLVGLYHSLFTNEQKELYHCSIDIVDCQQMGGVYGPMKPSGKTISLKTSTLPKYMNQLKPHKSLFASTCDQIIDMINEHQINVVIVPNFIYDLQRSAQYNQIVKDIKKKSQVDIIGLYI